MARYRYEARDMKTGALLHPSLPLSDVRWRTALDPAAGDLTARLNLNGTTAPKAVTWTESPAGSGAMVTNAPEMWTESPAGSGAYVWIGPSNA